MAAVSPVLLQPRQYQEDAIAAVLAGWGRGVQRGAVVHATGLGKTVVMCHLIARSLQPGQRAAVIVHRDTLVKQTVRKLHSIAPHLSIGVVKAERNEVDHDVVVISVQTIARLARLDRIPPEHFALIVCDECHHGSAESYVRAFRYLGCYTPGSTRLVGFTATLVRADKRGLGSVFTEVFHSLDILWGIRNGYLVEPRGKTLTVDALDLDRDVTRVGGDYGKGSLGAAMVKAHAPAVFARAIAEHAADRQGIAFWPTVDAAYAFQAECTGLGIVCEVVEQNVSYGARDVIHADVESGRVQVISNVMTETEGLDIPQLSFVADGSPSSNVGLMIQKIGRGLRPHRPSSPDSPFPWMRSPKQDCLVFRLEGATTLRLASLVDLSPVVIKTIKDGESLTDALERQEAEDSGVKARIKRVRVTDADLFAKSSSEWIQTVKGYWFLPCQNWLVVLYPEDTTRQTFMVGKVWDGKDRRRSQPSEKIWDGMTLEYGMAMAESLAEELDPALTLRSRSASWKTRKNAPATEAQISAARGVGIRHPEDFTKVELSYRLSKVIGSRKLDRYVPPKPVVSNEQVEGQERVSE